jgi:putative DNA primase/helicase
MRGDADLIDFLQRWSGYCLTGLVIEHVFLLGYGDGGRGKGTFAAAQMDALGDYATAAPMELLMELHGDRHPADIASLVGARLAVAQEVEPGRAWATARLKALTGGDALSARHMRQDYFVFRPTFKLMVTANNRPPLRTVDEAIRRRLLLVPFDHKPAVPDPLLGDKLRAEMAGILGWMIDGCLAWQRHGLAAPERVKAAVADYLAAADVFGRWLGECCDMLPTASEKASALATSHKRWCEGVGERPLAPLAFREALERTSGITRHILDGRVLYRGVVIRPEGMQEGK